MAPNQTSRCRQGFQGGLPGAPRHPDTTLFNIDSGAKKVSKKGVICFDLLSSTLSTPPYVSPLANSHCCMTQPWSCLSMREVFSWSQFENTPLFA
eukprot:1144160-Pelagomonas_calceolata.AAC.3